MASPQICAGVFTKDAGAVTQTIGGVRDKAGVAFAPTFIVFQCFGYIGAGGVSNNDAIYALGFDSFTARRGIGARQGDGFSSAPSFPARAQGSTYHDNRSILIPDIANWGAFGANAVVGYASNPLVGTFDVIWETSDPAWTNVQIHYTAFGGSIVADVGSVMSSGGGTQTISGLAVDPTCVLTFSPPITADAAGAIDHSFTASFGAANDDGCQGTVGINTHNSIPAPSLRYQRTNRCFCSMLGGSAGGNPSADGHIGAFGSGSFEIVHDITSLTVPIIYAALEGVKCSIFTVSQPSGGVITLSGLGKTPQGAMFFSVGAVAATTRQAEARLSSSITNGSTQITGWAGMVSNVAPTQAAIYYSNTNGLISATPAATGATLESQISNVTFQVDGLRLSWGLADATARQILCLVFGAQIYAPMSPCSPPTVSLPIYPPPPVAYEDPCAIVDPRIHVKITAGGQTLRYGVQPLRETATMGGFKEPRLLSVSPCVHAASDLISGVWPVQSVTIRLADTDRALRTILDARGGLRGCAVEVYLTSKAQSIAEGPPRVLFAGLIYEYAAEANLEFTITVNDLIGVDYSLFNEEKQIPQRVVTVNDFPNAPPDAIGKGIPIVCGLNYAVTTPELATTIAAGVTGPGIIDGVYVGLVDLGGTPGTPGPGDLAALVADLQTSVTAGTTVADWGSRIGYADAQYLQDLGTVPSTYAALGSIIGFADLDALLASYATTGGTDYECVVVAGHAISEWLSTNSPSGGGSPPGPAIFINDVAVDPDLLGVDYWIPQYPGDTSWSSTFGSDLFTDITGTDGTVRRYTLIAFNPASAYADAIKGGATVSVELAGMEDVGDGTGALISNYFLAYYHLLVNFFLQSYETGAWLTPPTFLFSDGVTLLDRIDAQSFTDASDILSLRIPGGPTCGFCIGSGGSLESIRDSIANGNRSIGARLAQDDFGRLFIKVLDYRRAEFLHFPQTGAAHRTLRDRNDIMPGMKVVSHPDWQATRLAYQYAQNYHENKFDRDFGGGGSLSPIDDLTAQALDGIITKTMSFPWVRDDATALPVAEYYIAILAKMPLTTTYARLGLCGLEDGILQGVPMTHFNGVGPTGWIDQGLWIEKKVFDPKTLHCVFEANDVEHVLT